MGRAMKQKNINDNSDAEINSKKKKYGYLALSALIILLAVCGGIIFKAVNNNKGQAVETIGQEESITIGKDEHMTADNSKSLLDYALESGRSVFDAIGRRPSSVNLTDENTEGFVSVESCLVDNKTSNITLKASTEGIPVSDDQYYYLFALKIYDDKITDDMVPILKNYKSEEIKFRFSRHFGKISGILYKFVIAVKKDEKYVALSTPSYVTNPEEISLYKSNGESAVSKKGLLIDPDKLQTSELDNLGVRHAAYNIPVSRILRSSEGSEYPAVNYIYNGKTYEFNGEAVSEYDLIFSTLTKKGIEITAIILNDAASGYPNMIHPLSRSGLGNAPYYAFNGSDEEGVEYLSAISAFLAERYSGRANGRGVVANWVIGNEINVRTMWNYMEHVDLKTYVREYVKAYRVFYNVIKSVNSASKVYISLDQQWNRNINGSDNYDSRDILDEFNKQIKMEGNIDWELAIHPYNVPLSTAYIWKDTEEVKDSADTPMLSMANIEVVTDYLQQKEFLTEKGKIRSVILSELGYTSSDGEELQAAAIIYAYKKAEANPHIDSILFSRQTDAELEMEDGLAFGINNADGSHKYAFNVYKYLDSEESDKYTDFAKKIIGISDWSEIL